MDKNTSVALINRDNSPSLNDDLAEKEREKILNSLWHILRCGKELGGKELGVVVPFPVLVKL